MSDARRCLTPPGRGGRGLNAHGRCRAPPGRPHKLGLNSPPRLRPSARCCPNPLGHRNKYPYMTPPQKKSMSKGTKEWVQRHNRKHQPRAGTSPEQRQPTCGRDCTRTHDRRVSCHLPVPGSQHKGVRVRVSRGSAKATGAFNHRAAAMRTRQAGKRLRRRKTPISIHLKGGSFTLAEVSAEASANPPRPAGPTHRRQLTGAPPGIQQGLVGTGS